MKSTKRTPANLAIARAMKDQGANNWEVAERFGISETTVRQWTDPEYYGRAKGYSMRWTNANMDRQKVWQKERRAKFTPEERAEYAAKQRERYVKNPCYKAALKRLRQKYALTAQGRLAHKVRLAALAFSDRAANMFESFMKAVTGMTRAEFTAKFGGEGTFDHKIPVCAFDLANPEHLVRCCWVGNLQRLSRKENELKGRKWDKTIDIMTLPWVGTPDALVQAQTFISSQMAKLERYREKRNGC